MIAVITLAYVALAGSLSIAAYHLFIVDYPYKRCRYIVYGYVYTTRNIPLYRAVSGHNFRWTAEKAVRRWIASGGSAFVGENIIKKLK